MTYCCKHLSLPPEQVIVPFDTHIVFQVERMSEKGKTHQPNISYHVSSYLLRCVTFFLDGDLWRWCCDQLFLAFKGNFQEIFIAENFWLVKCIYLKSLSRKVHIKKTMLGLWKYSIVGRLSHQVHKMFHYIFILFFPPFAKERRHFFRHFWCDFLERNSIRT